VIASTRGILSRYFRSYPLLCHQLPPHLPVSLHISLRVCQTAWQTSAILQNTEYDVGPSFAILVTRATLGSNRPH
jgi:hypothetical protein